MDLTIKKSALETFRELGLMLFLIGAGTSGGAGFVDTLRQEGPILFFYGALMTLLPMIVGYFVATKLLKLSLLNNLGSITGGMTSTPALGHADRGRRHRRRGQRLRGDLSDRAGVGRAGLAVPGGVVPLGRRRKGFSGICPQPSPWRWVGGAIFVPRFCRAIACLPKKRGETGADARRNRARAWQNTCISVRKMLKL